LRHKQHSLIDQVINQLYKKPRWLSFGSSPLYYNAIFSFFNEGLTYSDIVQNSNFTNSKILKAHVSNNSGNNEWHTPENYIESARATMGRD